MLIQLLQRYDAQRRLAMLESADVLVMSDPDSSCVRPWSAPAAQEVNPQLARTLGLSCKANTSENADILLRWHAKYIKS